jgi:hypothetical protein
MYSGGYDPPTLNYGDVEGKRDLRDYGFEGILVINEINVTTYHPSNFLAVLS